jgi:basic membrane protein A
MRARWLSGVAALVGTAVLAGAATGDTSSQPLRIGLVVQNTDLTDAYQRGVLIGAERAVRELGVTVRTITHPPNRSSVAAFRYLAHHGYDLILTYGFDETADLDTAARQFPNQKFAIVDGSIQDLTHHPRNVQGGTFRTEQPAYLAGYLAALLERRRPGKDVMGSVGGYKIPTVDAYIAGFQAGARKADPGIRLLNGYSNDFSVQSKCRSVALAQIAGGAGAILQVADFCGLGALAAAKEKGVWGIGVDADQSYLGPFVLTSVVKRLDVAVFDTIKAFTEGKLRPGTDATFDLASGGVALGKVSPRVPRSLVAKLDPIRTQILSGAIHVPSTLRTP